MDIYAAISDSLNLAPGGRALVPAGFRIELPPGYEAQLRPRSGLAIRHGVTLLNSPGTIDSDYRGEVGAVLINHGQEPFLICRGDRIAQMILQPVCRASWLETDALELSERGQGGFGHTGR